MTQFTIGEWLLATQQIESFSVSELDEARLVKLAEQFGNECKRLNLPFFLAYSLRSDETTQRLGTLFNSSPLHRMPIEMLSAFVICNHGLERGLPSVIDLSLCVGAVK